MNPWLALIPAAASLFVGAWLSYQKDLRACWWFPWAFVALMVCNGLTWAWMARRAVDDRQLFTISIAWDVLTITAYNLMPLVLLGVRLSPVAIGGVCLVVAGACLVKWG
jgi:multidrug transporter EmrE-like cation transporter